MGRDPRVSLTRDGIPGVSPVKAALQRIGAISEPTYRFWGHRKPPEQRRHPIVDEAPPTTVDGDGVARLRIYEPIDSWGGPWGISAGEFSSVLDQLKDVNLIELRINSPGGEVFEAVAIMNLLRSYDAQVTAVVDGIAASAASFIAASADETVMGRNSELMIHDASGLVIGNATDMHKMGDVLDHLSDNIAAVYAEKAGGDLSVWRDAMRAESWYSADEAVAAGLADRVDNPSAGTDTEPVEDEDQEQLPDDEFDMSVFAHAGRKDAGAPPAVPTTPATPKASDERELAVHTRKERLNASRHGLPV